MEIFIFYFISVILIGSAIMFMVSNKIVHSIFYCFIAFISLAGMFLLLDAPFIAAAQVFIYGGAVTVLLLFVVMLTITDVHGEIIHRQSSMAFAVVTLFVIALIFAMQVTKWPITKKIIINGEQLMNIFAETLFKTYYFPFEVAGVLLLAALVGALYLAKEQN